MFNPAFAKFFLPLLLGAVGIFGVLLLVRSAVGDDGNLQVLVMSVGVGVILVLLVAFGALKKKL